MKHLLTLVLLASACAADVGVSGEALVNPDRSYSIINSNNGAPLCTVVNNQCNELSTAYEFQKSRATRETAMLFSRFTSNAWTCSGTTCSDTLNNVRQVRLTNCAAQIGGGTCRAYLTGRGDVGSVRFSKGVSLFTFSAGDEAESNPAGHNIWYKFPVGKPGAVVEHDYLHGSAMNSNGGAAVCPSTDTQCRATAARSVQRLRALRMLAKDYKFFPNGAHNPNEWSCVESTATCTNINQLSFKLVFDQCTNTGIHTCRFLNSGVEQGTVTITGEWSVGALINPERYEANNVNQQLRGWL